MTYKFWKHNLELIFLFCMIIISFVCTIIFVILTIINDFHWLAFVTFLIVFFACLSMLLFEKRLLIKVEFNENGIKLLRLKKETKFVKWDEIIEIKETIRSRTLSWLTFVTDNGNIDIEVFSKKMYDAIISACTNPNIRMMINNLECFKVYHLDN